MKTHEPDTKPLTRRQRQILALMADNDGSAAFAGGTRDFRWFNSDYGLVIQAYQEPEFFLRSRGLIRRIESNAPGRWYRLTDDGERRAKNVSRDSLFRTTQRSRSYREAALATALESK